MKKTLFAIMLLTMAIVASAETGNLDSGFITVEKRATDNIVKGESLLIEVYITNGRSDDAYLELREFFGGAQEVDMGPLTRNIPQATTSAPPYYRLSFMLPANTQKNISYTIQPLYFGPFTLPPSELQTKQGVIKSNTLTVEVSCNANGACETDLDENAVVCPEDCLPDKADELCDDRRNNVCDPDCPAARDPDCTTTTRRTTTETTQPNTCGDVECSKGENYETCPIDCRSGSPDGLCDKIADGICDSDCSGDEDPDCNTTSGSYPVLMLFVLLLTVVLFYAIKWMRKK